MPCVERLAYRLTNALIEAVLRSTLDPLFSEKVLLLTYIEDGACLAYFTCKSWSVWWKDLQGGLPVGLRTRGWEHGGETLAVTGRETMIENLGEFLSRCPGPAGLPLRRVPGCS